MSAKYDLCDIDDILINIADKYIKSVIKHSVIRYKKRQKRHIRMGLSFVPLDDTNLYRCNKCSLISNYQLIPTDFGKIKIYNEDLAETLLSLSDVKREIVLQNILFGVPIKVIAKKYNISTRTVERYKKSAIEYIKKEIVTNED